ncbi:MAG: single-stranded-DNA-specific exonuclease RecJ [Candidatus Moranbacteria bacterium]|nr:single-stranded-DNA-specific exonuclease RecJ [Candidatus Moranbacteria bacterium]
MKWKLRNEGLEKKVDSKMDQPFSLHPIVERILSSRGIDEGEIENFLNPDYERDVLDPFLFPDMESVVKRIKRAKDDSEKILIFGDYDADGVTSTVVMKEMLTDFGIETSIYIPDKGKEGYGMSKEVVKKTGEHGFSLIITVDCGISNFDEIEYANELGIDVIVTDHHCVPEKIPNAFAIVNPKMKNSNYPYDNLAGVGVAFKVAQAVYEKLMPEKKEQVKWLLDLVAIGTVADCVSLVGENRTLVKYGLIVLSKTKRIGLQELFRIGRIRIDESNVPDAQMISFQVAPRINAASRMSHAKLAYKLISEKDRAQARLDALEIEEQNKSRQKATEYVVREIKKMIDAEDEQKKVVFVADENFPVGIIGLVAGRIASQYNKPTVVINKDEKESKGSLRSIPQLDIVSVLEECSEFLEKFGGHAQAAGISVKNENLDKLKDKMNEVVEKKLDGKDLTSVIWIDDEVSVNDLSFGLVDNLNKLRPFGIGNPEPAFLIKRLIIQELKWVGNGEKHLKLFLRSSDNSPKIFEAIGFSMNDKFGNLKEGDLIDMVFGIQKDEWNGNQKLQLRIVDLKKREE